MGLFKCGRGKSRRRHSWSSSVPEPGGFLSHFLGDLDAEGRFWSLGWFWVFNYGVLEVLALQGQVWHTGLGASSLGGKPFVSLRKTPNNEKSAL